MRKIQVRDSTMCCGFPQGSTNYSAGLSNLSPRWPALSLACYQQVRLKESKCHYGK